MMHSDLEERSKLVFVSAKSMMMLNGVFPWSKPKRTDVIKEIGYFICRLYSGCQIQYGKEEDWDL